MSEQHFEMLWDCTQCDAKALLAASQRHCPMCGAAQEAQARYFPPEGQEVAVQGHRYVGVDWACGFCESPNSAAARHCVNCGAPHEGDQAVPLVADGATQAAPAPTPAPAPPAASGRNAGVRWGRWVLAALVVALLGLIWLYTSKHDETLQVQDKTWSRSVAVEHYAASRASDWCDALPTGAYQVTRSREQRSTRQVPDGQTCVEVRTDAGDGTFTKRSECSPRYRSEPVYDDKCSYRINRWQSLRTERLDGNATQAPAWPVPALLPSAPGLEVLGAQRLGARAEHYHIRMRSDAGKEASCELTPERWQPLALGQRLQAKVRGTGGVDCASLAAP